MKARTRILICVCLLFAAAFFMEEVNPVAFPMISSAEAATKIKLNKTKSTIYAGETLQLTLKGTSKKVKWSSSDKKIASVSKSGLVTAKKSGKATITAKLGSKKYTCKITVKSSIKSSKEKISLKLGETATIKVSYSGSNFVNYIVDKDNVINAIWEDPSSFEYPRILRITGESIGNAVVKLYDSLYPNRFVTIDVEVKLPQNIKEGSTIEMDVGEECAVAVRGSSASKWDYEFRIMNSDVVEPKEYGVANGKYLLMLVGLKAGSSELTVIDEAAQKEITITIMVRDPSAEAGLKQDEYKVQVGGECTVPAKVYGSYMMDYTFTVANPEIADVSSWSQMPTGETEFFVEGISPGSTTLTIKDLYTGEAKTAKITVIP